MSTPQKRTREPKVSELTEKKEEMLLLPVDLGDNEVVTVHIRGKALKDPKVARLIHSWPCTVPGCKREISNPEELKRGGERCFKCNNVKVCGKCRVWVYHKDHLDDTCSGVCRKCKSANHLEYLPRPNVDFYDDS